MARIIYGVAGQGFGHSSRSHLIGQYLLDTGNDVIFAASNQSYSYLKTYFKDMVKPVAGLHFVYSNGSIAPLKTLKSNISYYKNSHHKNLELFRETFEPFDPDLVITDFEPFSAWWAFLNKIPYISIDHEHFLTMCKLEHNVSDVFPRITSNLVTKFYYAGAAAYLILNFFKTPVKSKKAIITPPVVRDLITKTSVSNDGHILFYSTDCSSQEKLIRILSQFGSQRFIIYGFNQDTVINNCVFKKTQTERFIADLASCKAVIATAGFSLISECLYYRKKILTLPILGQYEQMINAKYIQKLGIGMSALKLDTQTLADYISFIQTPSGSSSDIIHPDNQKTFDILDDTISKILAKSQNKILASI